MAAFMALQEIAEWSVILILSLMVAITHFLENAFPQTPQGKGFSCVSMARSVIIQNFRGQVTVRVRT